MEQIKSSFNCDKAEACGCIEPVCCFVHENHSLWIFKRIHHKEYCNFIALKNQVMKNIFVTILNLQFLDFSIDLLYIQWKYILTSDSPHLDHGLYTAVKRLARFCICLSMGERRLQLQERPTPHGHCGKTPSYQCCIRVPFCPPTRMWGKTWIRGMKKVT